MSRARYALLLALIAAAPAAAADSPIKIDVDATDVARKIVHVRMTIPAAPGPITLLYPQWIPGEHGPTGPINNLAGLKLSAGGKPIPWRRDLTDPYAINTEVPAGANQLDVAFDYLSPPGGEGFTASPMSTNQLAVLNWNLVLLYPKGKPVADLTFAASLTWPAGWKMATPLDPKNKVEHESPFAVSFKPAPLDKLVDSPVLMGKYLAQFDLAPGQIPPHHLNIAADGPAALDVPAARLATFRQLVAEASALYGARHYDHYDFLLTLSDQLAPFGLEHHQSSDNRGGERSLLEDKLFASFATLLPHEFTHSWNGKYRRPDDLTTPDFTKPMKTDLLWVYEGLTDYLGTILAARSGAWSPEQFREHLAMVAAELDQRPGRTWRPLQDTADAAPKLYDAGFGGSWEAWRRGVDFYEEGQLIWLDADTLIREKSGGAKSLDDFCHRFHGGDSGPPSVRTYTRDEVFATLNEVQPNDWKAFFDARLNSTEPRAPLDGLARAGWKLVFDDKPNTAIEASEEAHKSSNFNTSLGFTVKEDGTIEDTIPGLAAYAAGISPGVKLVAVNGRKWSKQVLKDAIVAAQKDHSPIELLIADGDFYTTHKLNYADGLRQPHLQRIPDKTDLLEAILRARTTTAPASR